MPPEFSVTFKRDGVTMWGFYDTDPKTAAREIRDVFRLWSAGLTAHIRGHEFKRPPRASTIRKLVEAP